MKNDPQPLYPLVHDPELVGPDGSAKKRAPGLRKKILLGSVVALGIAGAAWGFDQYQTMQAKQEFLETAIGKGVGISTASVRWLEIQYLKTHDTLPKRPIHKNIYGQEMASVVDDDQYLRLLK